MEKRPLDLKRFLFASGAILGAAFGAWALFGPAAGHGGRSPFLLVGAAASLLVTVLAAVIIRRRTGEFKNSEERFRSLLEAAPDAIVLTTSEGRIVLVNSQAEHLFGYDREELLGHSLERLLRKQEPEAAAAPPGDLSMMSVQRRREEPEYVGLRSDGQEVDVEVNFSPLETTDGLLVINVIRDTTERRMSERRRAARYATRRILAEGRTLAAAAPNLLRAVGENLGWQFGVLWLPDPATGALRCSGLWHEPSVPPGEFESLTRAGVFPPDRGNPRLVWEAGEPAWSTDLARAADGPRMQAAAREGFRAAVACPAQSGGEAVGVLEFFSRTPQEPDESTLETVGNVGAQVAHFVQRRRAEEALRQSEARKAAVLEAALDAIVTFDQDGKVLEFNPAAEAIFGHPRAAAVGRDLAELLLPADQRDAFRRGLADHRVTGQGLSLGKLVETTALRADGTLVPVEWAVTRIRSDAPVLFTGYIRDLTERKRAEQALRESEERFRQLQKMEAIGTLAGGVAHDFNNLLTVILGCTEFLITRADRAGPAFGYLEMIKKSAERGASLTRQLLTFSRKQVLSPRVLDLSGIVLDMHALLQRIIGEDVALSHALAPDLRPVKADPGQVEQVIMNLAVNARDAMPRGGRLTIETRNVELDDDFTRACPGLRPGPYVLLGVTDTGCGMDEVTRRRLFEPFFTTKEVGKGTGLGLATVYGIVKHSGGHIEVTSEPGRGTRFNIYLPAAEDVPAPQPVALREPAPPPAPCPRTAPAGKETVLLVEDEDWVRALTRQVLQKDGYTVLEARHSAEALRLWDAQKDNVCLMVTDVVMPEMNGSELAQRLLQQRPDLKVLFMSGYTDDSFDGTDLLEKGAALLHKPFKPADLSTKVHALLCA